MYERMNACVCVCVNECVRVYIWVSERDKIFTHSKTLIRPKMPTKSYLEIYHSKDTRQSPCNNLRNIGDIMSHEFNLHFSIQSSFSLSIYFHFFFFSFAILHLQIKSQIINYLEKPIIYKRSGKLKFWKQKNTKKFCHDDKSQTIFISARIPPLFLQTV